MPSGAEWEIWNGVQFEGRSGATHAIDISLVPRQVGMELRQSGGLPFGRPRVAIDCKDVGQAGSVDEMRAFVARLYDVSLLYGHEPYLPLPGPREGSTREHPPGLRSTQRGSLTGTRIDTHLRQSLGEPGSRQDRQR